MTIPATESQISYSGDGSTVAFAIPFIFDTSADITVIVTDADGLPTVQSTGFSISGGGGSTGTCTFDAAPSADELVTLLDDPELTQTADYVSNDAFPAETHERALDRTVRQVKRAHQRVDRSIRVADGDFANGDDLLLPIASSRAGLFLAFDAQAHPFPSAGTGNDSALRTDLASSVASADGARLVGYRRTESGAGARTLFQKLGEVIHVADFGAVADSDGVTPGSGTNNTTAFRNAAAATQASGGILDLGSGIYRVVLPGANDPGGTPLCDFSDLSNLRIRSAGAKIFIDSTYTGSQFVEVFRFRDCKGTIEHIEFYCAPQPAGQGADRGPECLKFFDACEFSVERVEATGCRAAVFIRRALLSDPKGKNFTFGKIKATDTGYGLACALSGDHLSAEIETLRVVRSYYPYGVTDHWIRVASQDFTGDADVNISSAVGEGCQDLDIEYENLNSTVADATIHCTRVSFTDQTAAAHRNIKIRFNISAATASDFLGYCCVVEKRDNGGSPDTVDRGHILEDLDVEGVLKAKNGSHLSLGICSIGTWGAGEFVRNARFAGRYDGGGQPNINLVSLKDRALIENLYSSAQINLTGNTSSKITCVACESAGSFTASTADTSLVSYLGCKFGSIANQSHLGKSFFDCEGVNVSYTGTATGGTTAPTGSVGVTINGTEIMLDIPALSFTSNTNAFTITGMPARIRPLAQQLLIGRYTDNGVDAIGLCRVETDGTLRFFNAAGSSTFFTTSGTKGSPAFRFGPYTFR